VSGGKIALPERIAGVSHGQALGDGKGGAERGKGAGLIALHKQHVADLVVNDAEVALQVRVFWVLLCQALGEGMGCTVSGERASRVSFRE